MDALLIGVGATFVGTMYNIHYTRKNLKTAKYIDTITAQRIKWIDTIRDEVADITTNIHFSLNVMEKKLDDKTRENRDLSNDPEYQSKLQWWLFSVYTSCAFQPENTRISISDLVYKFNLLKLRLNPCENSEIAYVINYFIEFYTDGEPKFDHELQSSKEKATLLIAQFQMLFKDEWVRVKNESYGEIRKWSIKNQFNKLLKR